MWSKRSPNTICWPLHQKLGNSCNFRNSTLPMSKSMTTYYPLFIFDHFQCLSTSPIPWKMLWVEIYPLLNLWWQQVWQRCDNDTSSSLSHDSGPISNVQNRFFSICHIVGRWFQMATRVQVWWKVCTVLAPLLATASIQKKIFLPSDYHIKSTKKSFLAWKHMGAATNRERLIVARVQYFLFWALIAFASGVVG